ncbi:MAG: hypothetical protein WA902_16745, partial [Thermosynechococcaceae cyanobacterium]
MDTIRIEAEDLTLSTYQLETQNIASGGKVISLLGSSAGTQGTATSVFTGVTGTYNVVVGYYDENDGTSTLSLQVGNDQSTWVLDQNLGNGGVVARIFVRRTVLNSVTLTNGEAITLTGNV